MTISDGILEIIKNNREYILKNRIEILIKEYLKESDYYLCKIERITLISSDYYEIIDSGRYRAGMVISWLQFAVFLNKKNSDTIYPTSVICVHFKIKDSEFVEPYFSEYVYN